MKKPVDESVREVLRNDFEHNLFVVAGAGTGKTKSIVDRVVCAVCDQGIDPRKIIVTTFTEKAAGELVYKIRKAVESRKAHEQIKLQDMFIGTQHALCFSLLRELPFESGIDPEASPMDEAVAKESLERIAKAVIDEHFATPEKQELFTRLEFDPHSAVSFFAKLYEYRDLKPVEPADPQIKLKGFWNRHNKAFKSVPELLELNETDAPDGFDWFKRKHEQWLKLKDASENELIDWFVQLNIPDIIKKSWTSVKYGVGNKKSIATYLEEIFEPARQDVVSYLSYQLYLEFRGLYDAFFAKYEAWKREHGLLDFQDLLLSARDMLHSNQEARKYFHQRFDLIIVDEFQDTDPIMSEILMYLSEDGCSNKPWKKLKLKPGKLTVVGDEKQAIYRFRRADISVFNQVKKIVEAQGRIEVLTQNFRSVSALVDSFNSVFSDVFTGEASDGVTYRQLKPYKAGKPGKPVISLNLDIEREDDDDELYARGSRDKGLKVESLRDREAQAVCRWIKESVESSAFEVGGRPVAYGDFLLLFRDRKSMGAYARYLSLEGIPCTMDGHGFILDLPEVADFFRLFKGCVQPNDRVAVVGALRSMYLGVSDVELARHKAAQGSLSIDAKQNGDDAVLAALARLKEFNNAMAGMSPLEACHYLLAREQVMDVLRQTRPVSGLNIHEAIGTYISENASPDESSWSFLYRIWDVIAEGARLDPAYYQMTGANEVRMLTVHESKGLEAPIVVLCDQTSHNAKKKDQQHVFDRIHDQLFFKLGLERRGATQSEHGPSYVYSTSSDGFETKLETEMDALRQEDKRLLYVAATRASEGLVIPIYKGKYAEFYGDLDGKIPPKHLAKQIASLPEDFRQRPALPLPETMTMATDDPKADERCRSYLERVERQGVPSWVDAHFSHSEAPRRDQKGYGKDYGLVFHRVMELFVRSMGLVGRVELGVAEALIDDSLGSWARQAADEIGYKLGSVELARIRTHVGNVMKSDLFRKCLEADARWPEYDVGQMQQEGSVCLRQQGIMDLVLSFNHRLVIVDYKTDHIEGQAELAELKSFYQDQVDGYVSLMATMPAFEVLGELLFVDVSEVI